MGGVVFAENDGNLGKMGTPVVVAAGGAIPPGTFLTDAGWTANIDGTPVTFPAGVVTSDGSATSAGGNLFPMGAGDEYVWPWPLPWPLSQMPWP